MYPIDNFPRLGQERRDREYKYRSISVWHHYHSGWPGSINCCTQKKIDQGYIMCLIISTLQTRLVFILGKINEFCLDRQLRYIIWLGPILHF
jgi:hypothetical protein